MQVVFLQTEEKEKIIVATSEISAVGYKELAKELTKSISTYSWIIIGNKKIIQKLAEEIASVRE